MNRIISIGFISVGYWSLVNNKIKCKLISHHTYTNVLYSFICNGEIKYIGKTTLQLSQRLNGYQNPGATQLTNIRVNDSIKDILNKSQPVDIFILVDNGLLKYGNFRINLAAGLEDTLIQEINPEWNLSGRKKIPVDIESEKPELSSNPQPTSALIQVEITIHIKLGQAYYNQGFFNVPKEQSNLFAADNTIIEIQLGSNSKRSIQGYINRTANKNGTPRIMGGKELHNWIKKNFKPNETMAVDIISPVTVRLK